MNLKEKLKKKKRLNWLDVGCGGNFEKGFHYLDTFPENILKRSVKSRYFRADILDLPEKTIEKMGLFDLVRMQHVFEHFSYEEGQRCLKNCARLMKPGAYLVVSTPDLQVHIEKYLKKDYKDWKGFVEWTHERIPKDSPDSFYFSMFAHSVSYEPHKWCYDEEGLIYQLNKAGRFTNIKSLSTKDELASEPFTHNRPEEDVCVIAQKK